MLRFLPLLFMLVGLISLPAKGQWLQPNRLQIGASLGFGGLHNFGKPSFDLIKNKTTLRVAPGLYFMSVGLTQKIGWFKPRERMDRQIILNFYYHNNWFLANRRWIDYRKDQAVYQLMPGIHVNLNHLGTVYLEVSGGVMYTHERLMTQDKSVKSVRDHFNPMGEIRIGGIFLSRKEYHQTFPHYFKKKPVKKIQKRKLKFPK